MGIVMNDTIINYKLKSFLKQSVELKAEYINLLRFSNPKETKNQLWDMKLRDVDLIKTTFGDGDDENIIKIIGLVEEMDEEEVLNLKIVDFFPIMVSIKNQLKEILETEAKVLTPKNPNFKWEAVQGNEKMAKFGIYNTLESLSNGDVTKYEYIMDMEYSEVFTVLYMRTLKEELTEEMNKLKTQNNV